MMPRNFPFSRARRQFEHEDVTVEHGGVRFAVSLYGNCASARNAAGEFIRFDEVRRLWALVPDRERLFREAVEKKREEIRAGKDPRTT